MGNGDGGREYSTVTTDTVAFADDAMDVKVRFLMLLSLVSFTRTWVKFPTVVIRSIETLNSAYSSPSVPLKSRRRVRATKPTSRMFRTNDTSVATSAVGAGVGRGVGCEVTVGAGDGIDVGSGVL